MIISTVRQVNSYRALLQAIADLREYGHPLSVSGDAGFNYFIRAGRKIVVTSPIKCEAPIVLDERDSGLEIEWTAFCPVYDLDLTVTDGAFVRLIRPGTFGTSPLTNEIVLSADGGYIIVEGAYGLFDVSIINDGALFSTGAIAFGGSIAMTSGSLVFVSSIGDGLDLDIDGGSAKVLGSVVDDVDVSGGTFIGAGEFGDVTTSGGSGSFAYAVCDSFTDGGGTWVAPAT